MHLFLLMGICIGQVLSRTPEGFLNAEIKKIANGFQNSIQYQKDSQKTKQTLMQQIQAEKLNPKEQYGKFYLGVYLPLHDYDASFDKSLRAKMLNLAEKIQRAMSSLQERKEKIVKLQRAKQRLLVKEQKKMQKQLVSINSACKKAKSAQNKQRFPLFLTFLQGKYKLLLEQQGSILKSNTKSYHAKFVFQTSEFKAFRTMVAH